VAKSKVCRPPLNPPLSNSKFLRASPCSPCLRGLSPLPIASRVARGKESNRIAYPCPDTLPFRWKTTSPSPRPSPASGEGVDG
jgi:hypothetical protein